MQQTQPFKEKANISRNAKICNYNSCSFFFIYLSLTFRYTSRTPELTSEPVMFSKGANQVYSNSKFVIRPEPFQPSEVSPFVDKSFYDGSCQIPILLSQLRSDTKICHYKFMLLTFWFTKLFCCCYKCLSFSHFFQVDSEVTKCFNRLL